MDAVRLRAELAREREALRVALASLVTLRAERDAYWSALTDARSLVRSWAVLLARVDRLLSRPERERT